MPRLQECPAITALNEALGAFPGLRRDTLVDVTPATRHTSGLAIDIFFNSNVPAQKQHALDLIDVLCNHQKKMLWSDLIFTNFHIGGGVGGYGGDGRTRAAWTKGAHDDHIHLDWVDFKLRTGPEGSPEFIRNPYEHSQVSKQTAWRGALEADFQALASRWATGQPAPAGPAFPQWIAGWWRVVQDGDVYYYHFTSGGSVVWTYTRPASQAAPVADGRNQGTCSVSGAGTLTITWDEVGGMNTVETFRRLSSNGMQGDSNRGGPLSMTRI